MLSDSIGIQGTKWFGDHQLRSIMGEVRVHMIYTGLSCGSIIVYAFASDTHLAITANIKWTQ